MLLMSFEGLNVETQIKEPRDAAVSARIPVPLKTLIRKFLSMDTHINESDFIRDAIREKIRRDAPDLYGSLFRERTTKDR